MSSNESAQTSRRRKLSLNKKTPSRSKGPSVKKDNSTDLICTPTSANIPIPKKSLRNLKSAHESIETSDDSTAEIVWDNNSPSPSICAKPSKRSKSGNNDISSMLKHVPRKKTNDSMHDDQGLKTWMQDDLAVVTYSAGRSSAKKNNRTLRTQTQRKKARKNKDLVRAFQSLKSMMNNPDVESVVITPNSETRSLKVPITVDVDMSPINKSAQKIRTAYDSPIDKPLPSCINESTPLQNGLTNIDDILQDGIETPGVKKNHSKNDKVRNVACKTLYENTTNVTDSLMNFDFDDDDIEGCDSVLFDEKSPAVAKVHPVHRESTSSKVLFAEKPASKNECLESIDKRSLPCIKAENNTKILQKSNNCHMETTKNNDSLMNIDFDDDLDDFLATQPYLTNQQENITKTTNQNPIVIDVDGDDNFLLEDPLAPCVEKVECMISQNASVLDNDDINMSFDDILDDKDKKKPDIHTTKNQVYNKNLHTPKQKLNVDLIGFDDDADDIFDDIVLSLEGDIKCKSQETPPQSLTSDQRKLKSRCHTSPFPLTSKRSLLKNDCRTFDDKSNSKQIDTDNDIKNNNSNSKKISSSKDFTKTSNKQPPDKDTVQITLDEKKIDSKPNTICTNNNNENINNTFKSSFSSTNNKGNFTFKKTVGGNKMKSSSLRKPPLDFSIIGKKENQIIEEDEVLSISNKGGAVKSSSIFSSTQKCSMDEIQRKREEAQMKLKQRNQMRK